MSTVLCYGRQEVDLSQQPNAASMIHHANRPCPKLAARMGNDAMGTYSPWGKQSGAHINPVSRDSDLLSPGYGKTDGCPTLEAPLSGMSMNPARTLASAIPSDHWTAI